MNYKTSHRSVGDSLLKRMQAYSGLSSWAVWSDQVPAHKFTVANRASTVYFPGASAAALACLQTGTVFVAMNPGGVLDGKRDLATYHRTNGPFVPWANFHYPGGKSDYLLAESVRGTPWRGSYMTDLLPLVTSKSAELHRVLRANPALEARWVCEFEEEMALLSSDPMTLICFSRPVHQWATKHLPNNKFHIKYAPHISPANGNEHKRCADMLNIRWVSREQTYPEILRAILHNNNCLIC